MGNLYDAPNQQVVRPDGSGPWEEGTGGSTSEPDPQPQQAQQQDAGNGGEDRPSAKVSRGSRSAGR